MAAKTIWIMVDMHKSLVAIRGSDESFSDELRRLARKSKDIRQFAGAWSHVSNKEIGSMKKAIEKVRGGMRMKEVLDRGVRRPNPGIDLSNGENQIITANKSHFDRIPGLKVITY